MSVLRRENFVSELIGTPGYMAPEIYLASVQKSPPRWVESIFVRVLVYTHTYHGTWAIDCTTNTRAWWLAGDTFCVLVAGEGVRLGPGCAGTAAASFLADVTDLRFALLLRAIHCCVSHRPANMSSQSTHRSFLVPRCFPRSWTCTPTASRCGRSCRAGRILTQSLSRQGRKYLPKNFRGSSLRCARTCGVCRTAPNLCASP